MTETTGSLRWAVKDSFARYVAVVAAGTTETCAGASASADGTFRWPLGAVTRDDDRWVLEFTGSVHFVAHHGLLDVDLRDPELSLSQGSGILSIRAPETSSRIAIAAVSAPEGSSSDDDEDGWTTLAVHLTDAGVGVFGNVYPLGTELAPISARVTLDS